MTRILAAAGAAAAALSFVAAAHAADVRLAYGDLDVSQPDQARVLDQRLDAVARAHCDGEILTGTRIRGACVQETKDALIQALPSRTSSAYKAGLKAGR